MMMVVMPVMVVMVVPVVVAGVIVGVGGLAQWTAPG
jgi:hypothetical protein